MTETLTWFGGMAGVVVNADPEKRLHLIDEKEGATATLCGIYVGFRPVTRREADRDGCWCETCFERAQVIGREG